MERFESALAKVNLALHITDRRADGYHLLETLVVFVELGDELMASPADRDSLSIAGPFAEALGKTEDNLVLRALAAFRARWPGALPRGLALRLAKNLPVSAGLGGGSADAAAALRLFSVASTRPIAAADLAEVAAELGSDVPMCLCSRPLLARGVGEVIAPLPDFPTCYLVLVNPRVPLATADVFRALAQHAGPGLPKLDLTLNRPAQLGPWLANTRNDLEPAAVALVPAIGALIERLQATSGCICARMSGSGATVFGLFGSAAQAHQAANDFRVRWPHYWVAAASTVGVA